MAWNGVGESGGFEVSRCRANMADSRQSRKDAGLDFQIKLLQIFEFVSSLLRIGDAIRLQVGSGRGDEQADLRGKPGSNRPFQILKLKWRSPKSSDLWYKSRQFQKTACSRLGTRGLRGERGMIWTAPIILLRILAFRFFCRGKSEKLKLVGGCFL